MTPNQWLRKEIQNLQKELEGLYQKKNEYLKKYLKSKANVDNDIRYLDKMIRRREKKIKEYEERLK